MPTQSCNPYTPPAATVADSPEAAPRVRPPSVRVALWLFFIALGIDVIVWIRGWELVNEAMISPVRYFGAVIGYGIAVWLYLKMAQGRNWARIIFLIITLVRAATVIAPMVIDWRFHYFMIRTGFLALVIEQILMSTALFLVFFPGREWFKPRTS